MCRSRLRLVVVGGGGVYNGSKAMAKTKAMCGGCRDDFYNHNREGGCWMYAKAKVVERMSVGTWQNPPYHWSPQNVLSCFHGEGFSMIPKDDCRVVVKELDDDENGTTDAR